METLSGYAAILAFDQKTPPLHKKSLVEIPAGSRVVLQSPRWQVVSASRALVKARASFLMAGVYHFYLS
jgi:hypothetical protein